MPKLIKARSGRWPIWMGAHPQLLKSTSQFAYVAPFEDPPFAGPISEELAIAENGDTFGHDVMNDWGLGAPLRYANVPIAPLYARDLAGRVLYIGRRPICPAEAWQDSLTALTPDHAVDVHAGGMEGADLLENVFFVQWRLLEPSSSYASVTSGSPTELSAIFYDQHNLYPYKLRIDSFYGDGWRLPQLNKLHVVRGKSLSAAEECGAELLRLWQQRTPEQGYEAFLTGLGESFVEEMYSKGCTLIPTFEASNGYNKVSADFELEDYWPGQAVPDLHKIVETRASDAPRGTILEVLAPGFALENRIEKAQVVISDGSAYQTPHADDPQPAVPDIRLPHTRSIAKWGATWIPTRPSHFEAPAIWGWDGTGHFVQLSGPLWDPLHYYYSCTPKILKAERTDRLRDNPSLIRVPDEMRLRFHPVVAMQGFDFFNYRQLVEKYDAEDTLLTMIQYHGAGRETCDVGYHPLPLFYEHELDNWWFPELLPSKRMADQALPFNYEKLLCPVVTPQVNLVEYQNLLVGDPDAGWVTDAMFMDMVASDPLENYPQLSRYLGKASDEEIYALTPEYLEDLPDEILQITPDMLWAGYDSYEDIENLKPGLYMELQEFRDKSLKLMRLRHRIYRQNINLYMRAYWEGTSPQELEKQFFEADSGSQGKKPRLTAAFGAPPVIVNE